MPLQLRSFDPLDAETIVGLSLRAWEPVFVSMAAAMDPEIERLLHPDWRASQREAVEACWSAGSEHEVWVADLDGIVIGFVAVTLHRDAEIGEIHMLAVDPEHQDSGVGGALTELALAHMRDAGMSVGMVDTGGDPGHAPARRTYERAGFSPWPVSRYFKKL